MHTQTKHTQASRHLVRGLAAGLLLTQISHLHGQTAPAAPAAPSADQATPVQTSTSPATKPASDVVVLDTFNVTGGFAGSLAAATEVKQEQVLISEAIAAEDIGKLPDVSIAESLTRLPGVTTQRLNGRAQAIAIRGMNGNFSTGLLNGREQVSTGAGRAVEYDQYPAELLTRVVLYKGSDAGLVGQGLSGTVDMQTVRPLNQSYRTIAANAFYEWNSMAAKNAGAKNHGERETITYIDQFANGKVGLALGYTRSNRPGQGEQWNAWGYPGSGSASDPYIIGGAKPFVRTSELDRDGYLAVLEFKPTEGVHSTFDLFYSNFEETQLLRGIEIPLVWGGITPTNLTVENGFVTKATFNNVYGVVRNDFVKRNDHLFAGGWNLEVGDKHGWLTTVDLAYSRVKRKDLVLETYSGFASNKNGIPDTMVYTAGGDAGGTFASSLDYTDATKMHLTSPQGWASGDVPGGQVGFVKGPFSRDELGQYKLKTERALHGFLKKFEIGAAYTTRNKYEYEAGPDGKEGFFLALKNGATSAPLPASVGVTDLSFIGIKGMYSYDPLALYNSGFYDLLPNNNPSYVANNWSVDEKVSLAYAKFDIDQKLGSMPLTGNFGAQFIKSEQTATGKAANGSLITPVEASHSYPDFVPSLNLVLSLTDRSLLRLSAARQLARQPMVDMRAGSTYSYNKTYANNTDPYNSAFSASGGNPALEPWRSNSYDLSFEHYFKDRMGYFAIAAFHKDLVTYTYNRVKIVDFTGYPTGLPSGSEGSVPATYLGRNTVPTNGNGGSIQGVEFALSLPGEKFTQALKGFGFIGSFSVNKSKIVDENTTGLGQGGRLPGLSDKIGSLTFYYEAKNGFSARISGRYRSEYNGDIATFGPRGAVYRIIQAEKVIDAQVSYKFKKGSLKNLEFILQGTNLTDEPLFATNGTDTRRVQDYQHYGASYSVGAAYKF